MSFETHITLKPAGKEALDAARQWAHLRSLKWTHIELSSGHAPSQPMLTFWGDDSLDLQLRRAKAIQQELEQLDIQVVRIKTECIFPGEFVPPLGCTKPEESNQYFECHVKLRLKSGADLDRLRSVVMPHQAHVSWNAIKTFKDGESERFVTLRSYHCTCETAQLSQLELAASLRQNGFNIVETESEFVLYDSNFALDTGWN
jgi:hypothetical protein